MNYWELRRIVKTLVPRQLVFIEKTVKGKLVKEKGRKSNYFQYNIETGEMDKRERLLNLEEMNSFIEVSLRSQACPMSLNADVYDGKNCPYRCQYCYADYFRASLYSSFFDNTKNMGLRVCSPEYFKPELEELFKLRGSKKETLSDVQRAISLEMPIRLGIRFENFVRGVEDKRRVGYEFLKFLAQNDYPVMINTKSDLLGEEDYLRVLSDNSAKAAVHITMISSDEKILKDLEPSAPTFKERLLSGKKLEEAGVRVVARIEPFMVFVNDSREAVDEYIERLLDANIRHITFDTYSYSAAGVGIKDNFNRRGYDFDRMYEIMSRCQWLGSLLLGKFMEYLRSRGLSCSTFDGGNVPTNDDPICCEVGNWFGIENFCMGNTTSAIRFIASRPGKKTAWKDYEAFVKERGGFLSNKFRAEVYGLWNLTGDNSFSLDWAAGLKLVGRDIDGLVWTYDPKYDFREEFLRRVVL